MGQLLLGQTGQHIALILAQISCPVKQIPAGFFIPADTGIVTGDHILTAQFHGPAQQPIEFKETVAVNTGIWGSAALITADEFLNDLFFKISFGVEYVEGKANPHCNAAGIFRVIQAAAG